MGPTCEAITDKANSSRNIPTDRCLLDLVYEITHESLIVFTTIFAYYLHS
jgi:hypothetical protein